MHVFILGFLGGAGFSKNPDNLKKLLRETFQALASAQLDIPIFVKPHPVTDKSILLDVVNQTKGLTIIITGLHPSILATRSRFFIGNCYSNTFYDAHVFGVPTIEYGEYSEELAKALGGKSSRPEYVTHYIQSDIKQLKAVLRGYRRKNIVKHPIASATDETGLIKLLAKS